MSISVCMATFNGAGYIAQQIESILCQLKVGDELIISDDGSTDGTQELISSFNSSFIKLIAGPQKGLIKNFENALKESSCEYIFLCDQDDIWMPNKVSEFISKFEIGADLIVSDCSLIDSRGSIIQESFFSLRSSKEGLISNLIKNSFLGCCMAFRAEFKSKVLPFPNNIPMHDWWIGLLVSIYGHVAFLNKPLMFYRRHGKNASPTSEKSSLSRYSQIKHRCNLILSLLWRYIECLIK